MIKNIVFDMGKVLVGYDAEFVCRHFIENPLDRKEVLNAVFASQEWLLLDMGIIPEDVALERMVLRLSTNQQKEYARLCLEHWHEYCMWPMAGMEDIVRELKEKGYGIYLCSNASLRMLTCYKQAIPGITYFDGVLFSAEEKCIKPQKEIYERLFEKFSLKAEECFFVDDLQLNIDGAKNCGMDGYCFADGDVEKLKQRLWRLNESEV